MRGISSKSNTGRKGRVTVKPTKPYKTRSRNKEEDTAICILCTGYILFTIVASFTSFSLQPAILVIPSVPFLLFFYRGSLYSEHRESSGLTNGGRKRGDFYRAQIVHQFFFFTLSDLFFFFLGSPNAKS